MSSCLSDIIGEEVPIQNSSESYRLGSLEMIFPKYDNYLFIEGTSGNKYLTKKASPLTSRILVASVFPVEYP